MSSILRVALLTALATPGRGTGAQSEIFSVEPLARVAIGRGAIVAIAHSANGDSATVLTQSGRLVVIHARTGAIGTEVRISGRPVALARSRDDARTAVGAGSEVTFVRAGRVERTVRIGEAVTAVAFSPTGAFAAVGTNRGNVVLVNVAAGDIAARLGDGHAKRVAYVAFTGAGETLVSIGESREIVYWDAQRFQRIRAIADADPILLSATATPAGDVLFVGTESSSAAARANDASRDIRDIRTVGVLPPGANPTRDISYLNGVRVYDVRTASPQKTLDLAGRAPIALAVAPDCRYVSASVRSARGSALVVFDIQRGASVLDLPLAERTASVAFAPDGRTLAVGNDAGEVTLMRVTGVEPRPRCIADLRGTKFAITGPRTPLVKPVRRLRFAVLDLDDNGVGPAVSRAVADQITNRLAMNPGLRLVERRRIGAIIQEQNFQQSGRTDPQTAVALARILNVEKVLLGAVAKLGTTMTITVQMVDVETAAIDGSREIQCRACELEDLPEAVAELAETLVAEADSAVRDYPEPPSIELRTPRDDIEVADSMVIVSGTIQYTRPLAGIELLVNGKPHAASRMLERGVAKQTPLAGEPRTFSFVQPIALDQPNNLIVVRAIGADGNDEQRYITVRRAARAPGGAAPPVAVAVPGITPEEIETALRNRVARERITSLIDRFGIAFDPAAATTRLRDAGADAALLRMIQSARRTSSHTP